MNKSIKQTGFTLIEILVVMGILSTFLLILTTIMVESLDVQAQSESYSAVTQEGRYVMARLNYDIKRSSAITTPASLGGSGASLVMTVNSTTFTYAVSGNMLQLTDGSGTANLTDGDTVISGLNFQRIGNTGGKDTIRYTFTLTSNVTKVSGPEVQSFTATAERR